MPTSKSIFEESIEYLLKLKNYSYQKNYPFDFIFSNDKGKKVLLEVRTELSIVVIKCLKDILLTVNYIFDYFFIVVPEICNKEQVEFFEVTFQSNEYTAKLLDGKQFAQWLGFQDSIDPSSPLFLSNAQAAIASRDYKSDKLGIKMSESELSRNTEKYKERPDEYKSLYRQCSGATIDKIYNVINNSPDAKNAEKGQDAETLESILKIGTIIENIVIVYSDIKNFTKITSEISPESLQSNMLEYYNCTKELLWKYNGFLDKFIGDAVFAVFGYPFSSEDAWKNAICFSIELIKYGRIKLNDMQKLLNPQTLTGTRIGITHGKLAVINLGSTKNVEITFLSEKINLAERLQRYAMVNGINICDVAYSTLEKNHPEIIKAIVGSFETKCIDEHQYEYKYFQIMDKDINNVFSNLNNNQKKPL